ncbi:MAG: hypothetical protein V3V92_06620, partial [Candidatus Hydrothermarchaeales archaeon]
MPPILTGNISALLAPDLYRVVVDVGMERPMEFPFWVNVIDMPWRTITDQQVSGPGTVPQKPENTVFPGDDPIIGGTKSYTAIPWGLSMEVSFESWDDELYGYLRDLMSMLARSSRNRSEVNAHNVLNEAFVTTNNVGFDSAALASTAHTALDGRTAIANRPATDVGLSQTAIQNGLINFHDLTEERNLPQLMSPSIILSGATNVFVMRELLGSSGVPFSTDNEMNSIIPDELRWMVSHYIDTQTNWFMMASKGVHDLNFPIRNRPV